ncbi:MAG: SDR family NAD(P)-dependent oxidoreductase [Bradymonadia bacterium]
MAKRRKLAIDEATRAKDLSGRIYIVTGANSGVGLETTRQLVKQGGHVVMACRRPDAGEAAAQTMVDLKGSCEVMQADLADFQSVRDFVSSFKDKHDKLHGLACNAGMVNMSNERQLTRDGIETTIGISYFGHFLLTELLLDRLKQTEDARMVILSSVVHAGSPKSRPEVHFDDLNWEERPFKNFAAYAEAKVATNLYVMELAERLEQAGVTTASVHPGWARSNFGGGGGFMMRAAMTLMRPITNTFGMTDSSEESAQTSLHVLLSDEAPEHSGAYFSQSSVLYRDAQCKGGGWPLESPNPNAKDMNAARKLVALSYDMVGLSAPGA